MLDAIARIGSQAKWVTSDTYDRSTLRTGGVARRGEVAVAFVIPRAGRAVGAEDLQAYCRGKLAGFKQAPRALGRAPHAG